MISVICVFNNKEILDQYLIKGLNIQNVYFESIFIDNQNNKYASAAAALNCGASKATGDILVFVHQDILFNNVSVLLKLENDFLSLPGEAVVGVAGIGDSNGSFSNMKHGSPERYSGKNRVVGFIEVQTLDECLFAVSRDLWENLKLDESVCKGWHLYSVEYCLSAIRLNAKIYVLDMDVYHRSSGLLTEEYYDTMLKITQKHRKYFKYIYTTICEWSTIFPEIELFMLKRKIKNILNNLGFISINSG